MAPTWAVPGLFKIQCSMSNEKWKKLISPLPRGGRQIGSSVFAFLSRHPFGYPYLPIVSNGGLEAVVSKRFVQDQKGLTAHRCSFQFCFSPPNALFLVTDQTTKLEMKDLLKDQQLWVDRDSNLIPPQYRPNALTTAPCSPCF